MPTAKKAAPVTSQRPTRAAVNKMSRDQLDVLSRKYEAEMNILRSQAGRNPEGFEKTLKERQEDLDTIQGRIYELDQEPFHPDPEGTAPTLADAEGNFAEDAEVAQIGGINVKDSNTRPDEVLARQKAALEEQGIDPNTVQANQLAGVAPSRVDDGDDDDGKPARGGAQGRKTARK